MPRSNTNALANPFRYGGSPHDEGCAGPAREVAALGRGVRKRAGPDGIDATVGRLLELPAELGAARGRRVALVLDEFQEVVAIDPGLPRVMRSIFQLQPEVAHVYLGSKRHVMERIFSDENEPFWRSAKAIELGPIAPQPFVEFIVARFGASGRAVDEAIASALVARTCGHPYATQELAYFLWEETAPGATAGSGDLERALAAVLRSEHAHFSLLWESCAKAQRLLLEARAREQPGRRFTSGYRAAHGLPSVPTRQEAAGAPLEGDGGRRDGGVCE